MNLTLSWDLFIIVFFAIVITYTFIIGKNQSVRVIIATYIAIVGVQGIGNLLQRVVGDTGASTMQMLGISAGFPVLSTTKLLLFVILMILLTIHGGFDVHYAKESIWVNIIITALCGFATAGLLLCAILTYAVNLPLLDINMPHVATLSPLIIQSPLMQLMVLNQDLWFSLPALVLIGAGFAGNSKG